MAKVNPDIDLTFRPLPDVLNGALTLERALAMLSGFFSGLSLLAGGDWTLRHHLVRGRSTAHGNWNSYGVRRNCGNRRAPGSIARPDPGQRRGRQRRPGERLGSAVRDDAPVWAEVARSTDSRQRRRRVVGRGCAGRMAARK